MPHYRVERTFQFEKGLGLPGLRDPLHVHMDFSANNARAGVTWIHSYVTPDDKKSFCLYEGPDPEAVRQAAGLNGLPVDRINEVHRQVPYTIHSHKKSPSQQGQAGLSETEDGQEENHDQPAG